MLTEGNMKMLDEIRRKVDVPCFIIEPTSIFKMVWNVIIIFLLFYTATVTPYRTAFYDDNDGGDYKKFYEAMDTVVDVVFGLDIIVNFISAYEKPDGSIQYGLKYIALNYLTGFFMIDIFASFPFNLF